MINRKIWLATCLAAACGLTASVFAQDPQSTQMQSNRDKSITVTGCLQRDTQTPVGTSGTTSTAPDAAQFKLTSVTSSPSSATTTAGTSGTYGSTGTSGSSSAAPVASEYRLDADSSTLSAHVGEKVEITGTLDDHAKADTTTSSSDAAPRLKVDHVKMIAASCQ
jgi:hypothetical protein